MRHVAGNNWETFGKGAVLLLSGGIDSTALAKLVRPDRALFVDYGQRPATAEKAAAGAVAAELGIACDFIDADLSSVGSGLLINDKPDSGSSIGIPARTNPSPEWWPMRNQLLCTLAAAWALSQLTPQGEPLTTVLTATVSGDGARHIDGTADFYAALNTVTRMQEGSISVAAPAITLTAVDLVRASGADARLLGWTHSCHRSSSPCAACPGCWKREQVLNDCRLLGHQPHPDTLDEE